MNDIRTAFVDDVEQQYVVREQYVGDIRDKCIERHNAGQHGKENFRLAASFPHVVIEHYCNVNGIAFAEWCKNPEHARRMLNSAELTDFRVWGGRV